MATTASTLALLLCSYATLATPVAPQGLGNIAKPNVNRAPRKLSGISPRNRMSRLAPRVQREKVFGDKKDGVLRQEVAKIGGTAPMGEFWDPLGISNGKSGSELKRYREAEITHGRVAMLGAMGFMVQEQNRPLFNGIIEGPAIRHFERMNEAFPGFWIPVVAAIGNAELTRARKGWEDPRTGNLWKLKDSYTPGDMGFDPLGLYPAENEDAQVEIKNRELNNGRLAMLALAGFMAQELVTDDPIYTSAFERYVDQVQYIGK
eukprot:CAMPEP_0184485164 /NCGR_PEP_ID=MMETSP0113_2-20130426/6806_1 /TAXON_ID=91329 /ORGANISM="Norrisiella sphaerica, Strain BC52" /LENGTH=261 /DNA_ID=CAMNT_0026866491 /DNA_START=18 /DNA_END=803 /DNA_ORIENTATION=-